MLCQMDCIVCLQTSLIYKQFTKQEVANCLKHAILFIFVFVALKVKCVGFCDSLGLYWRHNNFFS